MKTILLVTATMASFNVSAASFTSKAVKLNIETALIIQSVNTTLTCWTDSLRGDGDSESFQSSQSKVALKKITKGYELSIPSQTVNYNKGIFRSFQGCSLGLVGFNGYNVQNKLPLDSEESLTLAKETTPEALDAILKEVARITTFVSAGNENGSLRVERLDK